MKPIKIINIPVDTQQFKDKLVEEIKSYYGDQYIMNIFANSFSFKVPFSDFEVYVAIRFKDNVIAIGKNPETTVTENMDKTILSGSAGGIESVHAVLSQNSIMLSYNSNNSTNYAGNIVAGIFKSDNGIIAFSLLNNPKSTYLNTSISISITEKEYMEVWPLVFGNRYLNTKNETMKQPLMFTDQNGIIYKSLDWFNIAYNTNNHLIGSNFYISPSDLSSKGLPIDKLYTSLLIYEEGAK